MQQLDELLLARLQDLTGEKGREPIQAAAFFKNHIEPAIAAAVFDSLTAAGCRPNKGHCRSCKADVIWVETRNVKRQILDRNGKSHWGTCPNAAKHRRGGQ